MAVALEEESSISMTGIRGNCGGGGGGCCYIVIAAAGAGAGAGGEEETSVWWSVGSQQDVWPAVAFASAKRVSTWPLVVEGPSSFRSEAVFKAGPASEGVDGLTLPV